MAAETAHTPAHFTMAGYLLVKKRAAGCAHTINRTMTHKRNKSNTDTKLPNRWVGGIIFKMKVGCHSRSQ
jgi:hypothetical protein